MRVAVAFVGSMVGFAVLLFVPAGRLGWPAGWAYVGLLVANFGASLLHLRRVNPELVERRLRLGPGTERWDVVWSIAYAPVFLSMYVVAGLDAVRFGWAPAPGWLWPVGLVLFAAGALLLGWSMGVNPFFEKTVRIQTDRGHRVIDRGPYAWVRHPGYAGFLGWIVATPLLLGSWWAFAPAALAVAGLVVRTALEDRTLQAGLAGYADYARRVRHRLVPGLW